MAASFISGDLFRFQMTTTTEKRRYSICLLYSVLRPNGFFNDLTFGVGLLADIKYIKVEFVEEVGSLNRFQMTVVLNNSQLS